MRTQRGFTLLEVLLAAAVTALLAGLLLALIAQVLTTWTRVTGKLSADAQATLILDQVAADLEAALVRWDDGVSFAATMQRDQSGAGDAGMTGAAWPDEAKPRGAASLRLRPASGDLRDARFGHAGVWLRFFTAAPDSNADATNRSAPRAVAYQVVRRQTGGRAVYQLYRSQVRPGGIDPSTFSTGYDLFVSGYTTPNGSAQHPGNVRRPNVTFLLGNHVVDFGVRIETRRADGTWDTAFPATDDASSFLSTTRTGAEPAGYAGRPVTRGIPAAIYVMVRVLDEDGATRIAHLEAGRLAPPVGVTRAEYWWQLAEAHSRVHTRRIVLPAVVR